MKIALLADLHSNLEATQACIEDARRRGAERFVFLGDYVGYNADPLAVTRLVMAMVAEGAIAVRGNHDDAVLRPDGGAGMNEAAQAGLAYSAAQLGEAERAFLASLPFTAEEDDRLYVHAEPSEPEAWRYIEMPDEAREVLEQTPARLSFCGHVHVPRLFGITATLKLTNFRPVPGVSVPLPRPRQYMVVLGSVGQPRDGERQACYGIFDTRVSEMTWWRAPYDVQATAEKIRAAGLPESLALRLERGR
ncbi:metallophosphoesterase family protein [Acetobacteraceae bacterium H6797]|nr:metallophosphoesterase family protein [Acetobacteraceae bacterium H6797]